MNSNKECRYPAREKRIVLLDSQFQRIQARVKYLEAELRKAKEIRTNDDPTGSNIKTEFQNESLDEAIEDEDYEEYIDPFDEHGQENNYFGTATCQMFDSSLNAFLFKFTNTEDNANHEQSYTNQTSRYFLKDSSADKPFSGVLMLPDKEYSILLIQKVINFLGHEYFFINPDEFLQKVDETYENFLDRDPTWLCYLLLVLAVGEQFLNESSDGDAPGMRFFMSALLIFRNYYENPSLELVQTLLLFAFYQQGLNRTNAAFSFYGLALRNALTMGLHRKTVDSNISSVEREKRKRVWWTVFVMDSIWSAKISQPVHVQIEDTEVDLPNVDFLNLGDDFDPELLTYNVKLGVILSKIMRKIYRPSTTSKGINLKSILECLDDLDYYQNSLPSRIKNSLFMSHNRSVANLYLRLNQAVIITTRPLVLSIFKGIYDENAITKRVVKKCTIAAKTTIDMLINLKNNGWFSTFGFWDAQYCFSSLLILIMSSLSGHHFPQIEIGRKINGYMKAAGNFTAMENDMRLNELDYFLKKVNEQKSQNMAARRRSQPESRPDFSINDKVDHSARTSSAESQPYDFNNQSFLDNGKEFKEDDSPISALINEIAGNFSAYDNTYDNIHPVSSTVSPRRSSMDHHKRPSTFLGDLDNRKEQPGLGLGTLRLDQDRDNNNKTSDRNRVQTTPNNSANVFKDDFSPETWNSLVLNLQLWDSSNIGNSFHHFHP